MFRFEFAYYLYFLAGIPVVFLVMLLGYYWRKKSIRKLGRPDLITRLMPSWSIYKFWFKNGFLLLSLFFCVIALSNPQWGTRKEKVKAQSADVFIALDISNSMMAEDINPNRLERAKKFGSDLIKGLKGDRIGLILFAGGAYLQMPMTSDYAAADLFLKSANTRQAGTQGTAIAEAIDLAERAFENDHTHQRALVIISDGENHDQEAIARAEEAAANGLIVFTVGVGTEDGAYIPVMVNGRKVFKLDENGSPVQSRLNIPLMQELASAGKGDFYFINQGKSAIDQLQLQLSRLQKREVEQRSFSEYNSYFQYFLLLGIFFLLMDWVFTENKGFFGILKLKHND